MREFIITIGYFAFALLFGIIRLLLSVFFLFYWLWGKWSYTAQSLRNPPPPGGMYGMMAKRLKERQKNVAKESQSEN